MSTIAAPLENCFSHGGDENGSCAKRIKLAPTNHSSAEINDIQTTITATNGVHVTTKTTERRKSATTCSNGTVTIAENGHQDAKKDEAITEALRRNQDGEISDGYVTKEGWKVKWERGKTRFHKTQVHAMLKKYFDRLSEEKEAPRFFVPLCGKSVDMIWLLEKGCSVVGCELVELGVKQFFTEHDIEYTTEPLKDIGGLVYKAKDKNITIYCTDFFKLSGALIGQFDCVWDRGSMAAINPADRKRYHDIVTNVMKPDSRYLLDVFEVPHDVFSGPPHNIEKQEVKELFGSMYDVEILEHVDAMNPWSKTWGVTYFYENVFLLTTKK